MLESIVSRHNEPSSPKASRLQRKIPGKGGRGQVRQRSAATQNPAWLNSASAVQKAYNSAPARTVNAILRRPNACPSFTATQVANHYFNLRPAVTSLAPEDYHSIPAPQCWTDTLMDLMIEQSPAAISRARCSRRDELRSKFATQIMSPHDASMFFVIPVNLRNHWQMIVLNVTEHIVHYYCSLHQHDFVVLSSLLSLVELSGKHIGCTSWRVETHDGAPMQTNAFDCGPFACLFLKHLLHAIDMNFSDRESAALRTDLKFMIDAVAYPVVPATANPKTFKPDGSTTQLTQFQQKFLDVSATWQSTDVDLQAVYDEMVAPLQRGKLRLSPLQGREACALPAQRARKTALSLTLLGKQNAQSPLPWEQRKNTKLPAHPSQVKQRSLTHLFSAESLGFPRSRVGKRALHLPKEQGRACILPCLREGSFTLLGGAHFWSLHPPPALNISSPTPGMFAISQSSFMPDFISFNGKHDSPIN
ncbi:Ubiquitin-like-specific protease ESD4 [Trichinella pseudospiralis]|uniref:Ubiquitin-like-specific protease ESD4 n=1 Tax=Trichinella pseudospiralis TaxID=6337 RepID=A0A0V1JN39_TRIPS|nr:Ubiquitin-like-specific protease ESD4 [Trichinella pseudospiralis]